MARAAPRPCTQPGCGALSVSGRCERHPRKAWEKGSGIKRKLVGRALQAKRAQVFGDDPCCKLCRDAGKVRLAVILDHIVPLNEGGTDEDENLQGLCQEHSDAKTAIESRRGRWRSDPL